MRQSQNIAGKAKKTLKNLKSNLQLKVEISHQSQGFFDETSFKTYLKLFSCARQPSNRYLEGCPSIGLYNDNKNMVIQCVNPKILQEKQKKLEKSLFLG